MKEQTTNNNTKHSNSFTQHCIGILILLFTISTLNLSLSQNNRHNLSQNNNNPSSNTLLSTIVFICSFINTASHISVVAGTLQEVLVLSILIGVSFDVVSQLLYVTFLMTTHSIVTNDDDTFMIRYSSNNSLHVLHLLFGMMMIPSFFVLQIMLHIRALRLHVSYSRMNQVVQSAQNNIMQKPGRCYVDHLFAYSDLGHHVFYFMLSSRFLGWVRVVRILLFGLVVVVVIVMGIVVVAWKWCDSDINTTTIHPPNMTQNNNTKNEKPPLLVMQDGKPVCSCNVCQNKRNDHQQSAFLVDVKEGGICKLWFMTFGQLCTLMECTEEEKRKTL